MPRDLSLSGLRIVITRPSHQAASLRQPLVALGAEPIEFPTIEIAAGEDLSALDEALHQPGQFDWIVFTSANGVDVFADHLDQDLRSRLQLGETRLAAIGPATAMALQKLGLEPVFTPPAYVGESLAEALPEVEGSRVLLLRASEARSALPELLAARGATVDEIPIYRTRTAAPSPEGIQDLQVGVDAVTFTSPSTVRGWVSILERTPIPPFQLPGRPVFACIGPITAQAAMTAGCPSVLVADRFTSRGLVNCLLDHFASQER